MIPCGGWLVFAAGGILMAGAFSAARRNTPLAIVVGLCALVALALVRMQFAPGCAAPDSILIP